MHVVIAVLHRPTKPTGVCRHAANLALGLAERPDVKKVTLVVGKWQAEYFRSDFCFELPNQKHDKIHVHSVDCQNRAVSRNLWFLFGLPKLCNQLGADIVHLSFPCPIVRSRFKSPVVATIHDLYPYEYPENFGFPQVWFNQLFLRLCIWQSDGLSCVSYTTQAKLAEYFGAAIVKKKASVIYNSVEFGEILPKRPQFVAESESFLLCVAQHRRNKNIELLIHAYARFCQTPKGAENSPATMLIGGENQNAAGNTTVTSLLTESKPRSLIIVGSSGPETEAIEACIQTLGLQESVLLVSSINDEELRWLYQHCLFFVIASSTEVFCLPLVEALSLNTQVVYSDIPIFREVVRGRGISVALDEIPWPEKVDRLSQALSTGLSSSVPEAIEDERFRRSKTTLQYLSFYHSVLCQSKPGLKDTSYSTGDAADIQSQMSLLRAQNQRSQQAQGNAQQQVLVSSNAGD